MLLAGCLLAAAASGAQTTSYHQTADNLNVWLAFFGTHPLGGQWSLLSEVQFRRSEGLLHPQQFLVRPGIAYHFSDRLTASLGYFHIETYPYGEYPIALRTPENTGWQQLAVSSKLGRVDLLSRIRLEERFVRPPVLDPEGVPAQGSAVHTNRFWMLQRISFPLRMTAEGPSRLYGIVSEEVLLNFGRYVAANVFDQNRFFAGFGYRLRKGLRLETGYLHQLVLKPDGIRIEQNHTLQAAVFARIPFTKQHQ
jgi:hypothetical protein